MTPQHIAMNDYEWLTNYVKIVNPLSSLLLLKQPMCNTASKYVTGCVIDQLVGQGICGADAKNPFLLL